MKKSVTIPFELKAEYLAVVSIACLATAIRIIFLLQVRDNPFLNHPRLDALFHDTWALSIANGNLLGSDVFFRAPLYPYFLGLLYSLFGHEYFVVRVVQHAFGVLTCLCVYALVRRWCGVRTSAFSALLVAFNPMLIYFEGQLLFEPLLTFLIPLWLLVLFNAMAKRRTLHWLLVGIFLGFLGITRPPFLGIGTLLVLFVAFKSPVTSLNTRRVPLLAFTAGVCAIVLPITLRNYIVGDDFVLIASQGGVNFFIGNNPDADGISSSMPGHLGTNWENRDATYFVEKQLGHEPKPSKESAFWYAQAFQSIANEPTSFMALVLKKMYLFWNHLEIPNNLNYNTFKAYSPILQYNPFGFWLIGPMALLGLWLTFRHVDTSGNNREVQTLTVFVLLYFLFIVAFFICDRYRAPLLPILSIFTSLGLSLLIERLRQRAYQKLIVPSLALAGFAFLVNSAIYDIEFRTDARERMTLGIIALNENRTDDALQNFQEALNIDPTLRNLRQNMGMAEWIQGNRDGAIGWFHRELELDPGSFTTLLSLARIHFERREADRAAHFALLAVESRPYIAAGYAWLAKIKLVQGRVAEAGSILTKAAHRCDKNEFTYGQYLLASIHHDQGRLPTAEAEYRAILDRFKTMQQMQQPQYEPEFSFSIDQKVGEQLEVIHAKVNYGLALILLSKSLIDSAILHFARATTLDPQFGDAYADLGVALFHLRRISQADSALSRAVRLNPNHYLYWFNYGNVLAYQGHQVEATQAFERSLEFSPNFGPAKGRLALLKANPK